MAYLFSGLSRCSVPIDMHLPPDGVRVIPVIVVPCYRGDGSASNPERLIYQYFSLDGELLACYDEINGPPDAFAAVNPQNPTIPERKAA